MAGEQRGLRKIKRRDVDQNRQDSKKSFVGCFVENYYANKKSIIISAGRCIQHLRYSDQSASGTFSDLEIIMLIFMYVNI